MKKKLIPFALLFTYLLPLVGCGSKTCTITFDPNNGEDTFTITVNKGELLTEPESPEKTAYNFKAWRYNNVKWSFKYEKVQSDMTLKAYYTPTTYNVRYIHNGGSLFDALDKYDIETSVPFCEASNPGYVFDGFIDQDGNKIISPKGNYGDKVLTPQWKLDAENFIEFGSAYDLNIVDKTLLDELDIAIPSSDFVGEFTYNDTEYLRYKLSANGFFINDSYFPGNSFMYSKKVPITWLKLCDLDDNKSLYLSSKILSIFKSNYDCYAPYKDQPLRSYLNGEFISKFFSEEEASKLIETSVDNSEKIRETDYVCENTLEKVFPLSHKEMEQYLPKLHSFVIAESYDGERGLEYPVYIDSLGAVYSSLSMGTFSCGDTPIRNVSSSGCPYYHSMFYSSYDTGHYGSSRYLDIRPCIVLENK